MHTQKVTFITTVIGVETLSLSKTTAHYRARRSRYSPRSFSLRAAAMRRSVGLSQP